MNKSTVNNAIQNLRIASVKHAPKILTGVGIIGMIGTTVMAVKATPKAIQLLEEKKAEENVETLPPVEVIKTAWKCYIPAAVTGVASVACLIRANSISTRRNAALVTACNLSKAALDEYKDAAKELYGEKKEEAIREKIAENKIKNDPVSNHEVIMTKKPLTICYDGLCGRYFMSDRDAIDQAILNVNRRILSSMGMCASLNDFYDELGLPPVDIGDELGWNIDSGTIVVD